MISGPAHPLRFAAAGMIGMAVAMGFGRFVYTPILPGMMDELGLSSTDAGLIASANYLGYLIGALVAAGGWAHGRERLLMLGALAGSALLSSLMGFSDSLPVFLLIRFFAGLASAFVLVFLTSIVFSHLAAAGRGSLQAMHFGGVGVGIAVSSAMMAVLLAAGAAWPAGWLWSGVISAAGFAAVALLIDRGPLTLGMARREPRLPNNPALTRIILAYGLFGFGYIVTATFLVAIVRQGEAGRQFEALVWLVTGLAGIPSVWLWNRVARHAGLAGTFAISCIVEAVGVTASVAVGGIVGPLVSGVLLGGTFIAITALGLQIARLLAPEAPRRVLALMTASFGVGQIVGPIAAGWIAEWMGNFVAASIGAAVVLVLAGAIGFGVGRMQKPG
jgi:predicted MFS family arabinose efflux permease